MQVCFPDSLQCPERYALHDPMNTSLQDICCAFIYMHSRSPPVIHRDIKPANFLLDRAWKLKVCLCLEIHNAFLTPQQQILGSPC